MKINPLLLTDFYKISHRIMSEEGTEKIYSTFTPRGSRIEGIEEVVFFGVQGFIKEYLIEYFNENFFDRDKREVLDEYSRLIKFTLGEPFANTEHIEALHDLGYLPLKIMAVPEGTLVPLRVPMMTIENTHKDFYWLTNFLETLISAESWKAITTATISKKYFDISNKFTDETCDDRLHVQWQNHNFSYRGMSGNADAIKTGAGHLLFSTGTDTIPSICYLEKYYNADIEKELVAASVLATEHSIQCQYQDDERYFKRLINEVAPDGIVSIVSDGYDYWNVLTDVLPNIKDDIMARDGKLVIRPDSGDPVKIICGDAEIEDLNNNKYVTSLDRAKGYMQEILVEAERDETPHGECGDSEVDGTFKYGNKYYKMKVEIGWNRYDKQYYYIDGSSIEDCEEIELNAIQKGSIEVLWDLFGGEVNEKGYKVLDSHIGLIYGDAITPERSEQILQQLKDKGFASSNVVFGVGSYSLGYHTRDTFAMAVKATYTIVNGEEIKIFKDPKTDDGTKKSQRGLVAVTKDYEGKIEYTDNLNQLQWSNMRNNIMELVFKDGILKRDQTLAEIRERVGV